MDVARMIIKYLRRGSTDNLDSDFFNKYTTNAYYLSRGASGNVYGPIQRKKTQLAIKQIMYAAGKVTDKFKKDLEVKQKIWTSLKHENIMRIHSVCLDHLPKIMFIVMEFAAGGSLHTTLRLLGSENKLPIVVVTDWAKQIAEGMLYLHEKNIVHRDLKSSNILVMEPFDARDPSRRITLKITDFDDIKELDHTTTMSFKGTFAYMAPEVLQRQRFSKASDVWSYGVVLWEMLSGDIPYKGLESQEIIHKSMSGKLDNLPIQLSFLDSYQLLLKKCWMSDYEERPSFHDICCSTVDPMKINGIAVLGDEMFISRARGTKIEVYDSKIFKFKRYINVNGMTNTEQMASCSVNNCLYTFDWDFRGKKAILKIFPSGANSNEAWVIDERGGRLSVASDTNVILNINFETMLHEYTSDGDLIRIIDLGIGTDIFRVWHAVKLDNGQFVICQGCDGDPINRVCLLSIKQTSNDLERTDEVEILKEFGREGGDSINKLNWPMNVCVSKAGSILISDHTAVLMNTNLDKPRKLYGEEYGMGIPWKTCFDESTSQWFVCDGNRILVCRVEEEKVEIKLYVQLLQEWVLNT